MKNSMYLTAKGFFSNNSTLAPIFELDSVDAGGEDCTTTVARSNSFTVVWSRADRDSLFAIEAPTEYFVLLIDAGAQLVCGDAEVTAPARSVCVLPGGYSQVRSLERGRVIRLFAPAPACIATEVGLGGDRCDALKPIFPAFANAERSKIQVYPIDQMPHSRGMPRAKLFQCATLSINWVEYHGPRDRSDLSPHSHVDFEQGSLAVEGEFVHHLRAPWGPDASGWRGDEHLAVGPGTVAFIPPSIIHTTEGVGQRRHLLIDIFAPPRRDFIAKRQILNSELYREPVP
jgi:mannose-6-phosphate isomerase-like protein (cupin superfamily)